MEKKKFEIDKIVFVLFSLFLYFMSSNTYLDGENIAIYTVNYDRGIISNAFIGTVYRAICNLLGLNMNNYRTLQCMIFIVNFVYFSLLMLFFYQVMRRVNTISAKQKYLLFVLATIPLSTNFGLHKNFGSIDLYLAIITLCIYMLLYSTNWIWLSVPLVIIGQVIYKIYISTYYLIIVAMLLYSVMKSKSQKKQYKSLLVTLTLVVAITYVILHIITGNRLELSAKDGTTMLQSIMASADRASRLIGKAEVTPDIFGNIVWGSELWITKKHIVEWIIFGVLCYPFEREIIPVLRDIYKTELNNQILRCMYGGILFIIIFQGLLYSGTGRSVFLIIMGFWLLLFWILKSDDNHAVVVVSKYVDRWLGLGTYGIFLLVYLIMLFPLWGTSINWMTGHVADFLNNLILHIW